MKASLRELLTEIVDYAGLYPPAALELDPAIRNYARYRQHADAWMLGRFVCPAAKLAALEPYDAELFRQNPPFELAVIGTGASTAEAFFAALQTDLEAMRGCAARHAGRLALDAFEVRMPPDVLGTRDSGAVSGFLRRVDEAFERAGFDGAARFYEPALAGDWRAAVDTLVAGLAGHQSARDGSAAPEAEREQSTGAQFVLAPPWRAGFKLRTGGLEASAFPSPEVVAYAIERCRNENLPLKFTAGLHHPFRRFDAGARAMMHGFLNVFCASVLAHAVAFDRHDIQAVIEESDPRTFEFSDESIRWNDAEAMLDEIRFVRTDRCLSFGSCSFDEPRADLAAMGLT